MRIRPRIVLLGAQPTEAEVEYGWIEPGETLGDVTAGPYSGRAPVLGEAVARARREVPAGRPSVEYLRGDRQGGRPLEGGAPGHPRDRRRARRSPAIGRDRRSPARCSSQAYQRMPKGQLLPRRPRGMPRLPCRGSAAEARMDGSREPASGHPRSWIVSGSVHPGPTASPPRPDTSPGQAQQPVGETRVQKRWRRVQMRGGARRQSARRTQDGRAEAGGEASGYESPGERERATLSRLSRAPTKQMGRYHRSQPSCENGESWTLSTGFTR